MRFAIQIVTEVGFGGARSLKVLEKQIIKSEGKRALHLDIANDGERLLTPTMTVERVVRHAFADGSALPTSGALREAGGLEAAIVEIGNGREV